MKKIILLTILQLTIVMAGPFIMTEGSPLIKVDENTNSTDTDTTTTATSNLDWTPKPLPTQKFNVLDYGLKGNGTTDDTDALNALARNTNVTNWYFPAGYTFKLHDINPPSHVNAIFGGGTIYSHDNGNTDENNWIPGAIHLYGNGVQANPNLVIDGLTFTNESGFTSAEGYGLIQLHHDISDSAGVNQTEIRNCTFNNTGPLNGIKGYSHTNEGKYHQNLKIYDNTFTGSGGYFSIELINDSSSAGDSYPNLEVFDNHFSGTGGHGATSFIIMETTTSKIYNNLFEDCGAYGIELAEVKGMEVYNNTMLRHKGTAIMDGGTTWNPSDLTEKGNIIHHNHFETLSSGWVMIAGGTNSEIYENYFNSTVYVRLQNVLSGQTAVLGNIHDNTFVNSNNNAYGATGVNIEKYNEGYDFKGGTFIDNDVYNEKTGNGIAISSSGTLTISNNNVYISSTEDCITPGVGTQTENTCTENYSGSIPTSRTGAGKSN